MRKAVKLRSFTTEEEREIRRLAASRKEAHRLVQREKVIVALLDNPQLHATQAGRQVGFSLSIDKRIIQARLVYENNLFSLR